MGTWEIGPPHLRRVHVHVVSWSLGAPCRQKRHHPLEKTTKTHTPDGSMYINVWYIYHHLKGGWRSEFQQPKIIITSFSCRWSKQSPVWKAGITVTSLKLQGIISNTVHTVDGRNPAPVDMINIPLFTRFFTSQVVQDFSHQQYYPSLWRKCEFWNPFKPFATGDVNGGFKHLSSHGIQKKQTRVL